MDSTVFIVIEDFLCLSLEFKDRLFFFDLGNVHLYPSNYILDMPIHRSCFKYFLSEQQAGTDVHMWRAKKKVR